MTSSTTETTIHFKHNMDSPIAWLASRSQAKTQLAKIQNFAVVIFDFKGLSRIGQAFADEIFRVYANQNPQIELRYQNACKDVEFMILRAKG
jgi:hypothetical protein